MRGNFPCDHRKDYSRGWYWMTKTLWRFLWWSRVECDYCKARFFVRTAAHVSGYNTREDGE